MKPKRRNKHCVFLSLSSAGLCINRWCLEELVKRDAHNFLILLQKILRKTTEVQNWKTTSFPPPSLQCLSSAAFFLPVSCRWSSSVAMSWWCLSLSCSRPPSLKWVDVIHEKEAQTLSHPNLVSSGLLSGSSCGSGLRAAGGGLPVVPSFPGLAWALQLCQ